MASLLQPTPNLREQAIAIYREAVAAVQPGLLLSRTLRRSGNTAIVQVPDGDSIVVPLPLDVIGAGKGAAAMAAGCEALLGPANVSGQVISPEGNHAPLESIRVHTAGHPLPDQRGLAATQEIVRQLRSATSNPTLCLLSGGASSLLVCPRPPLTLADKVEVTRLLLECGASIQEINTVRKHLSEVKGGGLLRQGLAPMVTLIISDVVGDDPAMIGSGPTVADPTTFEDAWGVVDRYDLAPKLPATAIELLRAGRKGMVAETVEPGSAAAKRGRHVVVGSNAAALAGAAAFAARLGWETRVLTESLQGDTTLAARAFHAEVELLASRSSAPRICVLAGGETTVSVRGPGRGGRNQEFALALVSSLAGGDTSILSAGTDGIDGPTDAAGAFVDGATLTAARRQGLNPVEALARNDSYGFFATVGGLFRCGPTGTNVMDIKIALVLRS